MKKNNLTCGILKTHHEEQEQMQIGGILNFFRIGGELRQNTEKTLI